MKKAILFLSFIIVGKLQIQAQIVQGGLKAGLNFNQLNALGWSSDYVTNPFVGAYVNVGKKRLGLHVEALMANQRVTTDSSFKGLYNQYYQIMLDSSKVGSYSFQKLQVPVYLSFKFNQRFWVQFGAIFSNDLNIVNKNNFKQTADKVFKSKDVMLSGGIWLGLTKRFSISGRYSQSLSDINNLSSYTANPPSVNLKKWQNQQIQFGVGYKIF
jgi:Outer membrane protein beta-barrel domain